MRFRPSAPHNVLAAGQTTPSLFSVATAWALTAIIAVVYLAVVFGDPQRWSCDLGVVAIIAVFLTAVVLVAGVIAAIVAARRAGLTAAGPVRIEAERVP